MLNMGTFAPEIGLDISGKQPVFSFSDKTRAFLANPENYYWGIAQPFGVKAKGDLYAWKTDAKYDFDHPVLRDVRFGVRLTKRSASRHRSAGVWKSYVEDWAVKETSVPGEWPKVADLSWQRPNIGYLSDPRYAALGQTEQFSFPNFFGGNMTAPPTIIVPTKAMVHDKPNAYLNLLEALRLNCRIAAEYRGQTPNCDNAAGEWSPDNFDNKTREYLSEHSERTQAIFSSIRFGFDSWKFPVEGNAGLRIVKTSTVALGNMKFEPTYGENTNPAVPRFGKINEPIDAKSSHVDVLPSLNLKANLTPTLQTRLALSRAVYRPNFQDLQEYITLQQRVENDPTDSSKISQILYTGENSGNAHLKPLKANSFDVSLEWYPRPGQSLTAVAFYKKVKDVIIKESYTRTVKDLAGNDQDFEVVGPANSAKLWVGGIELAGMTYLDKIPGLENSLPQWARGLGVSANFTYLDGKQELYKPFPMKYCDNTASISGNLYGCDTNSIPFTDLPVPYFSKRAFNLAFMYDNGPVSARLAYSWRDRTLLATGVYGARGERGTSADPVRIAANGGVAPRDTRWYLPVWQEAVGQWDAGINYRFTDNLSAAFNVSNITETVTRQTHQQHVGATGRSWFDPGRSYRLSMGYNF
jgi:TonB-dependent receptor